MSEDTTCPTCGREDFKNEMGVKRHHSIAHGESIAGFKRNCEVCGESVTRKSRRGYDKTFCSGECKGKWQSENWSGEDNPAFQDAKDKVTCQGCKKKHSMPNRVKKMQGFVQENVSQTGGLRIGQKRITLRGRRKI